MKENVITILNVERNRFYYFVLLLVILFSNQSLSAQQTANVERDHLLTIGLMAYVFNNWQENEDASRGYNIGALLFDPVNNWVKLMNLNSVRLSDVKKTAHAEVGLMQRIIASGEKVDFSVSQIITTLEPCMMCSGMMTFLGVDSVKYIQTDPEFGKNIERLAADYAGQPGNDRCKHIKSVRAISGDYGSVLEALYATFRSNPLNQRKSMADFLYGADVKLVYSAAAKELYGLTKENLKFKKNEGLLEELQLISR